MSVTSFIPVKVAQATSDDNNKDFPMTKGMDGVNFKLHFLHTIYYKQWYVLILHLK